MANPGKRQVIFHCGAGGLALAVVAVEAGRLRVLEVARQELSPVAGGTEEAWMQEVLGAARRLLAAKRIRGPVRWVFSGSRVLTKSLRIPHVDATRRREVLAIEVQPTLPSKLEEMEWDYQVVGDDGVETEVLFFAVRKSLLAVFRAGLEKLGVTPVSINAASLLDANLLRWAGVEETPATLGINIGARSTNLTFVHAGGFLVRSVGLGGANLTQQIADQLGTEPAAAEVIKRRVWQGEGDAAQREAVLQQTRVFEQRLGSELSRSLLHFKRQAGAEGPGRVVLLGGGSLIPGLEERLAEKNKAPAERWAPDARIQGPGGRDLKADPEELACLAEILGEAVRDLLPTGAGINLLPAQERSRQEFLGRQGIFLLAAAALAVAAVLPGIHHARAAARWAERAKEIEKARPALQALAGEIADNRKRIERLARAVDQMDDLVASRGNWIRFFSDLQANLHEVGDVWLESLQVSRRVVEIPPAADDPGSYAEDGEWIPPAPRQEVVYRLSLSGSLLLREEGAEGSRPVAEGFDQRVITERIRRLTTQLGSSPFIEEAGAPTIFWTRLADGVLPFSFNLTVNPERPL